MTRLDALRALEQKVAAGEAVPRSLIDAAFPQSLDLRIPVAWYVEWIMDDEEIRGLGAAQAIQHAVLPGCGWDVDATAPECGVKVSIWSPEGPIIGVGDFYCEQRSRLLAIIRALIAEGEG